MLISHEVTVIRIGRDDPEHDAIVGIAQSFTTSVSQNEIWTFLIFENIYLYRDCAKEIFGPESEEYLRYWKE